MRLAVAIALVCAFATAAHADADEASLDVHTVGGAAITGDSAAADGETTDVAFGGLELRGTYATSDHYAYEVQVAFGRTSSAGFDDIEVEGNTGSIERATLFSRLTAGVTARLGVRYIPTVQLAVGAQVRRVGSSRLVAGAAVAEGPGADMLIDAVALAGIGLDYRHDKHWIFGLSVRAVHAFSFNDVPYDALEGMVSVQYYWYPRL